MASLGWNGLKEISLCKDLNNATLNNEEKESKRSTLKEKVT
jgi:hypothetical protein